MAEKNWTKSPWAIGLGTAVFSFCLSVIYDLVKDKPLLSSIWSIIKWAGELIWKILNFNVKLWWIILFVILVIIVLYIIDSAKPKIKENSLSETYKEDRIKGLRWSWEWEYSTFNQSWILSDLKAHCPKCDTPMIAQSSYGLYLDCPRCDFKDHTRPEDELDKVQRIIIDNVNRRKNKNNP
ncbi:MAG: hypothetical protein JXR36_02600 [Bacteroidales bacterium]|nr:hypothetical protein [Bacteroidales bacterium]